jgi:hypothetical protein
MADQPSQMDFQQQHARAVAASDLEVLGKRASAGWAAGQYKTLGEAVVDTVKLAGLGPEQVRRVIEFANTDAFLGAFHKLGSAHHYVDFGSGVLADPREVLRDLNDGGGGQVFDRGTADYDGPPADKTASVQNPEAEMAMWAEFSKKANETVPMERPDGWVWDERDKLAGATQHLTAELSSLEVAYQDCALDLYQQVKQAALDGTDLGQVVRAWGCCTDEPVFVKAAFQLVTPRLIADGVFRDLSQVHQSIEKTGQARLVNPDHPLVQSFDSYCEVLTKTAEVRQQRDRMANKLAQVNHAIGRCGGDAAKLAGAVGAVMGSFRNMGEAARAGLTASGHAGLGELAAAGIKAAPVAGALIGGKVLYDTASTHPAVATVNSRVNPMSSLYQQRKQYRRDMAMQQAMS